MNGLKAAVASVVPKLHAPSSLFYTGKIIIIDIIEVETFLNINVIPDSYIRLYGHWTMAAVRLL